MRERLIAKIDNTLSRIPFLSPCVLSYHHNVSCEYVPDVVRVDDHPSLSILDFSLSLSLPPPSEFTVSLFVPPTHSYPPNLSL